MVRASEEKSHSAAAFHGEIHLGKGAKRMTWTPGPGNRRKGEVGAES